MLDKELLELVRDDLNFLRTEWDNEISDSSLRRNSNVIRNLITYNLIDKASKNLGFKYRIESIALKATELSALFPLDKISLYCAGGANFNNVILQSTLELSMQLGEKEILKIMKVTHPERTKKSYSIEQFKQLTSFIVQGNIISKNNLIQYVANKKGGTHYDKNRKDNEKENNFKKVDEIFELYQLAEKNVVYFELLSIGQEIANNKDSEKLIEIINNAI